jgi:teichuronic acid biosynthesis glycosyltransferase TuaC
MTGVMRNGQSRGHPASARGDASMPITGDDPPLRALVFTSLFPSRARPRHGIFVETRLTQLIKDCPVDARVVAPVPWFPSASPRFGAYAAFAATPRSDRRDTGIQVTYPRYWMLPRVGVAFQADSMARGAFADVQRLLRSGWRPDLIDAHYLYPDAVAAAIITCTPMRWPPPSWHVAWAFRS